MFGHCLAFLGPKNEKLAINFVFMGAPVRLSGDNLQCPGGNFQLGGRALYFLRFWSKAGEGGGLKGQLRCP